MWTTDQLLLVLLSVLEVSGSLLLCRPIPDSSLSGPCLSLCSTPAAVRLPVYSLASPLAKLLDGNAIHVHGALLGQALAHGDAAALLRLVLCLTDEAHLLELLKAVSDVLSSGVAVVLRLDTAASLATVVLAESLDANLLSHVELVANGGCACVKPVIVQGVQLLVAGSLNGHGPLYYLLFLLETAIEID